MSGVVARLLWSGVSGRARHNVNEWERLRRKYGKLKPVDAIGMFWSTLAIVLRIIWSELNACLGVDMERCQRLYSSSPGVISAM